MGVHVQLFPGHVEQWLIRLESHLPVVDVIGSITVRIVVNPPIVELSNKLRQHLMELTLPYMESFRDRPLYYSIFKSKDVYIICEISYVKTYICEYRRLYGKGDPLTDNDDWKCNTTGYWLTGLQRPSRNNKQL